MRLSVTWPENLRAWPITVYRVICCAIIDLRYGGLLIGELKSRYAHLEAVETANSNYHILGRLFRGRVSEDDVLVDVGCGKGRVINAWLHMGHCNEMVGIELDPEVAARTRKRLARFDNVTIITGDAVENLPPQGTVFYLYNPFGRTVVHAFKARLETQFDSESGIRVIYYNAQHLDLFSDDPAWHVEILDLQSSAWHPVSLAALITIA